MDAAGWLVLAGAVAVGLVLAALGPWLMRDHRRRQSAGAGGSVLEVDPPQSGSD